MAKGAEPDSDELLDDLREAISAEAYLETLPQVNVELTRYLRELLDERGLRRSEVFRDAGIPASFGYYIFKGERGCGRETAIKLAFGLHLDLTETQRLLNRAGVASLSPKRGRDAVIIKAIDESLSRAECDDELFRLNFPGLMDD